MSEILTNPDLDPLMRERIAPGCWVYLAESWYTLPSGWHLVAEHLHFIDRVETRTVNGQTIPEHRITALHEPCREPKMWSAYQFGLPGTISRVAAEELIHKVNGTWTWERGFGHGFRMEDPNEGIIINCMKGYGGNTWRIVEG
jgi:hypothetical protein